MNTTVKRTPSVDVFEFTMSGNNSLEKMLEVATSQAKEITSWKESDGFLIFGRGSSFEDGWIPFLSSPTTDELSRLIIVWLKKQDYGMEPDMDGHCSKGWQVSNKAGFNFYDYKSVFAVSPCWIEFHK